MAVNINRVVLTGNLTRDPELRALPTGTSLCQLRIACNSRRKNNQTGSWDDKPNYFDVTVWGAMGETVARYLSKGSSLGIDGRLDWREWDEKDANGNLTGNKRQAVQIVADNVQFLGGRDGGGAQGGGFQQPRSGTPVDTSDFAAPAPVAPTGFDGGSPTSPTNEDDIPF